MNLKEIDELIKQREQRLKEKPPEEFAEKFDYKKHIRELKIEFNAILQSPPSAMGNARLGILKEMIETAERDYKTFLAEEIKRQTKVEETIDEEDSTLELLNSMAARVGEEE